MLKIALLFVKNVCFDVKKGISEFAVLGSPKTYCSEFSRILSKSVLFLAFWGFTSGIFHDFVTFTKRLQKTFTICFSVDVASLSVLRVNFVDNKKIF